ncbi:MAG: anti-sigma factor family protein, partial [Afipia sp.]
MMTDHNIPVTEDELHAYVDNELPAERRAAVEAWLAAHPEDAERVTSWRTMSDALHAKYDAVADEPVPTRLSVDQLSRTPRRWMMGAIAASLLAFAVGGGIGWAARGANATPSMFASFTGDALGAHKLYVVEVRHPVEVAGSDKAHLQQWLSKRCGWEVRAPEL